MKSRCMHMVVAAGTVAMLSACAGLDQLAASAQATLEDSGAMPAAEPLPPSSLSPPVDSGQYEQISTQYNRTVAEGAILGGVIGFAVAKATDGDKKKQVIFSTAGAVIGAELGKRTAKKSQELAQDRSSIENALEESAHNREEAAGLIEATDQNIAYLEERIADLEAQRARGQIDEAQYKADIAEAKRYLGTMEGAMSDLNSQIDVQEGLLANLKTDTSQSADADVRATAPLVEGEHEKIVGLKTISLTTTQRVVKLNDKLESVRT